MSKETYGDWVNVTDQDGYEWQNMVTGRVIRCHPRDIPNDEGRKKYGDEIPVNRALEMADAGAVGLYSSTVADVLAAEVRRLQLENKQLLATAKELLRITDNNTVGYATYNNNGSIAKVREGPTIIAEATDVIEKAEKAINR